MRRDFYYYCMAMIVYIAVMPCRAWGDTFSFTISSDGTSSSGIFTANQQSNGSYLVTSISGSFDGSPITLLPSGAFAGNDNLLLTGTPEFDSAGISFSANGTNYNLSYLSPQSSYVLNTGTGSNSWSSNAVTFTDPKVSWDGNNGDEGSWGGDNGDEGDNGGESCDEGGDSEKCDQEDDDDHKPVVPEPSSVILLVSGLGLSLLAGGGMLRRQALTDQPPSD